MTIYETGGNVFEVLSNDFPIKIEFGNGLIQTCNSPNDIPNGAPFKVIAIRCFPALYENNKIEVHENGSGEIFVTLKSVNISMRVSNYRDSFIVTAGNNLIEPTSLNGLSAFRISNRPQNCR